MKVKIGNKFIGDGEPCMISLEPGATHTGLESAKKLAKAVAESGADAIKFQVFRTGDSDRLMRQRDIYVEYQTPEGKHKETVYEALKRRELSEKDWTELRSYCKKLNLLFIASPYFLDAVDFLAKIKVDAIKVSKADINNLYMVEYIAKKGLPVILDGRENFEIVEKSVERCERAGNKNIIIMHCPSGYPSADAGVHLLAIRTIKELYKYPVGFADHSMGSLMNYPAVALGAKLLEVTVTLDKKTDAVEHYMSLEPYELKEFVAKVRKIEEALGNPRIIFSSRVKDSSRRSFVAKVNIKKGEKVTIDKVEFKRPGTHIPVSDIDKVLGKKTKQDIAADDFLEYSMLE